MVIRVRLTNGADFMVGGIIGARDGFILTNLKGDPLSHVFADEVVSFTPATEV